MSATDTNIHAAGKKIVVWPICVWTLFKHAARKQSRSGWNKKKIEKKETTKRRCICSVKVCHCWRSVIFFFLKYSFQSHNDTRFFSNALTLATTKFSPYGYRLHCVRLFVYPGETDSQSIGISGILNATAQLTGTLFEKRRKQKSWIAVWMPNTRVVETLGREWDK